MTKERLSTIWDITRLLMCVSFVGLAVYTLITGGSLTEGLLWILLAGSILRDMQLEVILAKTQAGLHAQLAQVEILKVLAIHLKVQHQADLPGENIKTKPTAH